MVNRTGNYIQYIQLLNFLLNFCSDFQYYLRSQNLYEKKEKERTFFLTIFLGILGAVIGAVAAEFTIGWTGAYHDIHEECFIFVIIGLIVGVLIGKFSKKLFSTLKDNKKPSDESNYDEIKKLKNLLDIGAITQEEFDEKKKQLLNL